MVPAWLWLVLVQSVAGEPRGMQQVLDCPIPAPVGLHDGILIVCDHVRK